MGEKIFQKLKETLEHRQQLQDVQSDLGDQGLRFNGALCRTGCDFTRLGSCR